MITQFCNKRSLAKATGLSSETFKKYRLSGKWLEGVHWQRINSRCVLYNLTLVLDWIANSDDPRAHQKAIEHYLASLTSNQPKARGYRAG